MAGTAAGCVDPDRTRPPSPRLREAPRPGEEGLYSPPLEQTEKAMAPHSSTLAWKIPWVEKPGGLQSMGSLRVGHD